MVPAVRAAAVVNGIVDDGSVHIHVVVVDVRAVTVVVDVVAVAVVIVVVAIAVVIVVVVALLRLPLLFALLRLPAYCSRCCGCRCCCVVAVAALRCSRCCGCRIIVRVVAIRLRVARLLVVARPNVEPTLPAACRRRKELGAKGPDAKAPDELPPPPPPPSTAAAAAAAAARTGVGKRDERALRGNRQCENECEPFHLVTLSIFPTRLMYVPFPLRRLITIPCGGSWVVECGSHCMESVIFAYSVPR